jgi:hypothetical protein
MTLLLSFLFNQESSSWNWLFLTFNLSLYLKYFTESRLKDTHLLINIKYFYLRINIRSTTIIMTT